MGQLVMVVIVLDKRRKAQQMRLAICMMWLVLGVALPAYAQQAAPPSAVPVGTVSADRKPIEKTLGFVGRVEAIERVDIKARVTGYLEAVLFKEGDTVETGDPLYLIEKEPFQAVVNQAEGALERAKAAKVLTEVQLKRAVELLAKNAGTVVTRDQALTADEQAKATIATAEANLETASINLGYTDITSPITGRIGRTKVTKGNVVSPESGTLTTIVSQDPMYVVFPVSQREFLRAQKVSDQPDVSNIKIRLRFSDGSYYDQLGSINFIDVSVDRTTDTVTVRGTVPNPKGRLIDGQLVQAELVSGKPEAKVVVPQSALIADQQGTYVFVVEDGKAAIRRIKTGGESGSDVVVESGLSGGEQIIVEGLQSIKPGTLVQGTPIPGTVSEN
jgi:membrane fusion protein, multidrug efflux system